MRNDIYPKVRSGLVIKCHLRRTSGNGGACRVTWMPPCNGRMARPTSFGTAATGDSTTSKSSSHPAFSQFHWNYSRRFMVDSGSPPFPRDAQDWLFSCYESDQDQVGDRQLFRQKKCFQKGVIKSNNTGVQVGENQEELVIERTISSNPFLVITLRHLGFS